MIDEQLRQELVAMRAEDQRVREELEQPWVGDGPAAGADEPLDTRHRAIDERPEQREAVRDTFDHRLRDRLG